MFLGTAPALGSTNPCERLLSLAPVNQYQGLKPKGLKALRKARDTVRERFKIFATKFRNMEMIHKTGTVARLTRKNMFLYGPPGGAKSSFVNWLFSGEATDPYKLQLHQMVNESAFLGKQTFENGRFDIDTDSGLAEHEVALLDEIDKGNPSALAVLMSLLNERKLLLGHTVLDARLESAFSTGNAILPEIIQQFLENGQAATAPALLNRFQHKAFVYNWLGLEDQKILDQYYEKKMYMEDLVDAYPELREDKIFLDPPMINWSELRQLSRMFELSPAYWVSSRTFVDQLRSLNNRAVRESELSHQQDHLDEPYVYFPSADYNERLREEIAKSVRMSAFLDFLLSKWANDEYLESVTAQPIVLDYLSLWRSSLMLTTIGPGEIRLTYNPDSGQGIDIDFGHSIDASTTRDKREEWMVENLKKEQERFRQVFFGFGGQKPEANRNSGTTPIPGRF